MHFRVFFLRSMYRMGVFFWLLKIQIFFGVLEIHDIFWGCMVDAGSEPTYTDKKREYSPRGCPTDHLCLILLKSDQKFLTRF